MFYEIFVCFLPSSSSSYSYYCRRRRRLLFSEEQAQRAKKREREREREREESEKKEEKFPTKLWSFRVDIKMEQERKNLITEKELKLSFRGSEWIKQ